MTDPRTAILTYLEKLDAQHSAAQSGPWSIHLFGKYDYRVGIDYSSAPTSIMSGGGKTTTESVVALHNAWPLVSAALRSVVEKHGVIESFIPAHLTPDLRKQVVYVCSTCKEHGDSPVVHPCPTLRDIADQLGVGNG